MSKTISRALLSAGLALAVVIFGSWYSGEAVGQTLCQVVSLNPTSFSAGGTTTATLTTNGTVDLSGVTPAELGINPASGIITIAITQQSAQRLTFSVAIDPSATTGARTFVVKDSSGHELVALDVAITAGPVVCNPPCHAGQVCEHGTCVATSVCDPPCDPEIQVCRNGRCVAPTCTPPCRPPLVCTTHGCGIIQ